MVLQSSTARTGPPYGPGLRGNLRRWSDATRGPGPYFGGHENLALFCALARLPLQRTWRLEGRNFQVPRADAMEKFSESALALAVEALEAT